MYNFDFIREDKEYFELRIPFENIEEINNCYEWTVADRPDEVVFYVQHYLDTKGMYNFYISTLPIFIGFVIIGFKIYIIDWIHIHKIIIP